MSRGRDAEAAAVVRLLDDMRTGMLRRWEERLRQAGNPIMQDREARRACLDYAGEILDTWRANLTGADRANSTLLTWRLGAGSASRGLYKGESIRAISLLYDVVAEELRAATPAESLGELIDALLLLHREISARGEIAAEAYDAYVADQVHSGQAAYRRRLAREIHDQLGNGLSVAMRQLELYELCVERDEPASAGRMAAVNRSIAELFAMIRWIISDLRACGNGTPLETSLWEVVKLHEPARAAVSVSVTGDSEWLPEQLRCEVETVVREAMRNAFSHARANNITVRVHIAPHGVRATVSDDGRGFEPRVAETRGHGLRSMRERVDLSGGTLRVSSERRSGTRVELWLPLPASRLAPVSVAHGEAATHGDDRAGDVGGAIAGQEPHEVGHLIGRADTA
jgi:signal transduction histidine kinase